MLGSLNGMIGAVGLGLSMLLFGSALARSEPTRELTFILPTSPAPYVLPVLIAQDLGWYEQAGLKLKEQTVTGDANSMRAVISGEGDITHVGPVTITQAFLNGASIRIIGSAQPIVDYRIIAKPDVAKNLADLADKRWATSSVGGMAELLPKMAMGKNGLDYSSGQFMSVGGQSARYQAVIGGTVDATIVDTAAAVRGEKDGSLRLVRSIADDFPQMAYVYFVVQQSELANPEKREALKIFIDGAIRGARYIVDHPKEAAEIMEKRLSSNDVEEMSAALQQMTKLGVWGINGGIERDTYEFTETTLRDMKQLANPVPYDNLVDTSLVNEALRTLGKR